MMRHFSGFAAAALLTLAALLAGAPAGAQALGPEGRVYAVETREGRYTAQFRRGGRYEDSRGATGAWQYDGRTLCVIVRPPRDREYEICMPWRDVAVGQRYESRAWTPDGAPARITRVE
ncbi:MAG: hypothetical protein ACFE0P_09965 [Oceanicaulis sp.]